MNMQSALEMKPRGMGEIIDLAVRIYRNNFWKFIGIIAVVQIPATILHLIITLFSIGNAVQTVTSQLLTGSSADMSEQLLSQLGPAYGITMLSSLVYWVFYLVATAALTRAIAGRYMGETLGIQETYEKIGRSWRSLLWAVFLMGLLMIAFMIWWVVPCIGWVTGFGFILFFSMVVSPLIAPVVVIERRSGASSLRRAWDLARQRFWWLIGFVLLLGLFSVIVVQAPVYILQAIMQSMMPLTPGDATSFIIQTGIQSLATLALTLLYQPLHIACTTLVYFDLRVRHEGFDLAWMARQVEDTSVSGMEIAQEAPVGHSQSLITWPEVGNFALLSLAFIGVCFGPYLLLIFFIAGIGGLAAGLR